MLQAERLPDQLSDDDLAFWSYVVEEQRPKSVAEAHVDYSDDEINGQTEKLAARFKLPETKEEALM